MDYVTVFDEVVEVFCFKSDNKTVRIFKCPKYPLNEFKLTCRNGDNSYVYCNIYVYGPPIPQINVKILKYDACYMSHVKCGNEQSREVTLSGSTTCTDWSFSDCGQKFLEYSKSNYNINVIHLKLEFSIPEKPKSQLKTRQTEEGIKPIELFNNRIFSDFRICVDDKTFHVSKSIIAINSNVLRSKISELFEQQKNQLVIEGFDASVIQKMLEFIYDENVNLGEDINLIEQLLLAANTYEVKHLNAPCEAILLTNLNAYTAPRYFEIAEMCNCKELKQKAVGHLSNKYPNIHQNPEFITFMRENPTLGVAICHYFISKLNLNNISSA